MDEVIQYGYKYEKDYDLYLVRRVDGEHLRYVVPSGLFMNSEYLTRTQNLPSSE